MINLFNSRWNFLGERTLICTKNRTEDLIGIWDRIVDHRKVIFLSLMFFKNIKKENEKNDMDKWNVPKWPKLPYSDK
jgi:hypothetical protein